MSDAAGQRRLTFVGAMRSALAAAFFVCFGLGSAVLGFVLFPLLFVMGRGPRSRRNMRACVRLGYRLLVWAARVMGLFRVEMSPEDRHALSNARGRIVVANHISLIDVVILMANLPDSTAVAKSAAGRNPFYSRIVSSVFLVNDDPLRVMDAAAELLSDGVNMVIFPEGTRTAPGTVRRLHRGAAQIALHSKAKVLCVGISCDHHVLAKGQPWWEAGERVVRYGLEVRGEIVPPALPKDGVSHSAAVALTNQIGQKLWPAK